MSLYDHHNGSIVANATGGILDVDGRVGSRFAVVSPNDKLSAPTSIATLPPGTVIPSAGGNWSGLVVGDDVNRTTTLHSWFGYTSVGTTGNIDITGDFLDTCTGYTFSGWFFNHLGSAGIIQAPSYFTVGIGYELQITPFAAFKNRFGVTVPAGCGAWQVTTDWFFDTTGVQDLFLCLVCDPANWKFSVYQGNLARDQWNAYHSTPSSTIFEDWHFASACSPVVNLLGNDEDQASEVRIFDSPITEADAQDLWNIV